jgi:predicted site-specific integrase-resolvase
MAIDRCLLNTTDAADFLGVTPGTMSVWRSLGRYQIPYIKVGSRVRYRLEDLEAFLQERTRTHTGQVK